MRAQARSLAATGKRAFVFAVRVLVVKLGFSCMIGLASLRCLLGGSYDTFVVILRTCTYSRTE